MAPGASCGEALIRLLEEAGFDTVFGIPGVHTLELYRGLAASGMRHVLARHEQGAGFMADGYARAGGRPALCVVITGPGVSNIATPMGQAYSDSVPMLVVSSANARADLGRGRGRLHESGDQLALTAPLAGHAVLAREPADIPAFVAEALDMFASRRPRPAHLHVPIDLLAEPAPALWRVGRRAGPPAPDAGAVEAVRGVLAAAKAPAIVAGGGSIEAAAGLRVLVESLPAPLVTTVAAKGVLPEAHALSLGATLSRAPTQELLAAADAVLAIGTELAETDIWRDEPLRFGGPLIRVDIDAARLVDDHGGDLALLADAEAFLEALGPVAGQGDRAAAERRVEMARARRGGAHGRRDRGHVLLLEALRRALPEDGFVATDMTQVAYAGKSLFPVAQPRSWFHPAGFGTLGYALPAAVGAMLATPGRPGLALAGDYGFQFTMQELGTAVELGLPLPVVIWNNEGLGQIRDDMRAVAIQETGVAARNPDFLRLAAAYGCAGVRPDDRAALVEAVRTALGADAPTLIEVRPEICR